MLHFCDIPFLSKRTVCLGLGILLIGSAARLEAIQPEAVEFRPANFNLSATRPAASLKVSNPGPEEAIVQLQAMEWSQENGLDRLSPSSRLIIHPEQVTLRAGEAKTIRIGLRMSAPRWTEEAYRVLINESRRPPDVGVADADYSGSRVIRRASLPVFVQPPGIARPRLLWRIGRNADGAVELHVSNHGAAHVLLRTAVLQGPAGRMIHEVDMAGYLLPGQGRTWWLAEDAPAGQWQLIADTHVGPMEAELKLEPGISAIRSWALAK